MELIDEESASELLQAQTHVWNHIFNFINSMTLKCAVQLGIPDVIHKHGKPMTLSELVSALPLHPSKTQYVHRLMRVLVHSGFFSQQNLNGVHSQEAYFLTPSTHLLLRDNPLSMRPLLLLLLDPVLTEPHDCLSTWLQNDEVTAFSVAHGRTIWEYASQDPRLGNLFNEAMASDSILVSKLVVSRCKGMFEGVNSLVDVGGGSGAMAKGIAEAFPHVDCTVFDLPRVVSDLQGSKNLKYVGGDMFEGVPPADMILLKALRSDAPQVFHANAPLRRHVLLFKVVKTSLPPSQAVHSHILCLPFWCVPVIGVRVNDGEQFCVDCPFSLSCRNNFYTSP